jgi:hypothetical protein
MSPRWQSSVVAVAVGVAVAIGLTLAGLTLDSGGCSPGPVVSTVDDTLTPMLLLNAPYNGSASGTVPIENGTQDLTLTANNSGGVWGYFERSDWTIRDASSARGSGSSCDGVYFASLAEDWSSDILPLFNSSEPAYLNDSAEPTTAPVDGTPEPVHFQNGFGLPDGELSTCGETASTVYLSSSRLDVGVQFETGGISHVVDTELEVPTHYEYNFPANGGTWAIDNLSAPGGPGGGWAFSYSPCTAPDQGSHSNGTPDLWAQPTV